MVCTRKGMAPPHDQFRTTKQVVDRASGYFELL